MWCPEKLSPCPLGRLSWAGRANSWCGFRAACPNQPPSQTRGSSHLDAMLVILREVCPRSQYLTLCSGKTGPGFRELEMGGQEAAEEGRSLCGREVCLFSGFLPPRPTGLQLTYSKA